MKFMGLALEQGIWITECIAKTLNVRKNLFHPDDLHQNVFYSEKMNE